MDKEKRLNKAMQIIESSGVTVLAGAPSSGKTSFALNLAVQCGFYKGGRVAIFSLEMSSESIVQRMISIDSGVELKKIIDRECSQKDWKDILSTAKKIEMANFLIDDTMLLRVTPKYIAKHVKDFAEKKAGVDFVIVDYLQLFSATTKQSSRADELRIILDELGMLAKQYHVPILVLTHLHRLDWSHKSFNEITAGNTIRYINFNCNWLLLKLDNKLESSELSIVWGKRKGEVIHLWFDRNTLRFYER